MLSVQSKENCLLYTSNFTHNRYKINLHISIDRSTSTENPLVFICVRWLLYKHAYHTKLNWSVNSYMNTAIQWNICSWMTPDHDLKFLRVSFSLSFSFVYWQTLCTRSFSIVIKVPRKLKPTADTYKFEFKQLNDVRGLEIYLIYVITNRMNATLHISLYLPRAI